MTDREMLELAAKAAGIRLFVWGSKGAENFCIKLTDGTPGNRWNPLTDDGDALRLAVRLGLTIKIMGDHVKVGWQGCGEQWLGEEAPFLCDLPFATRRAIVRAAAAMASGA